MAALAALSFWLGVPARAEMTSYRLANPLGWRHQLPVGETPGWSSPAWLNFELGQGNVWNKSATFTDRRTSDTYTYKADLEQTTAVIETGFASGAFAFALEVPYANHNGGFLDDFIDQFHIFGRFDRFQRDINPKYGNDFRIERNSASQINSQHAEGVSSFKTKFKAWLLPWRSPTPGACDCGFSVSGQVKWPVRGAHDGLSSGGIDYSALTHLGVPLGDFSGAWVTSAVTYISKDDVFQSWPMHRWLQMYELTLSLGVTSGFGILLQARVESPLLEQKYLEYNYTQATEGGQIAEKEASGWNALTEWRGSQTAGVFFRFGGGSQINLLIQEDWGLGDRDHSHTWNYVNNAPDVSFVSQWHFVF